MMLLSHAQLIYQDEKLFDNLDVPFFPQQWTCILGQSGVGKTSLLRMIAGLSAGVVEGTLHVNPRDIAYMAQSDLLLPWLSVLNNVMIGAILRDEKISPEKKNTAIQLLEKMGLSESLHKKPQELSGGMRQRVALARTLFDDKNIILMDEPFSSLDAPTKQKLYTLFKRYLANKTILFITHDIVEALQLGDKLFVLSGKPALLKPVHSRNTDEILRLLTEANTCAE